MVTDKYLHLQVCEYMFEIPICTYICIDMNKYRV